MNNFNKREKKENSMIEEHKTVYKTEDGMKFDTKKEALEWETFLKLPKVYLIYKFDYSSSSNDKTVISATMDRDKADNEEKRLTSMEYNKSYYCRHRYEIKTVALK